MSKCLGCGQTTNGDAYCLNCILLDQYHNGDSGKKYDKGKNRVDLVPPEVILELGKLLTYGANKYGANNWQGLQDFNDRYYAAILRHLLAWRNGENKDKESGEYHLSHALTNLVFLVWKQLKEDKK